MPVTGYGRWRSRLCRVRRLQHHFGVPSASQKGLAELMSSLPGHSSDRKSVRSALLLALFAVGSIILLMFLGFRAYVSAFNSPVDQPSCIVTSDGETRRAEMRADDIYVPPDQLPDGEVGDRYSSLDGCLAGDRYG